MEVPVPPQYTQQPITDFRHQGSGPRGFKVGTRKVGRAGTKRKLEEYEEQVEKEQAVMESGEVEPVQIGAVKKPKLDTTGLAKVSGRAWKQPAQQRAGVVMKPQLKTSWEKKMQAKAVDKAYKEAKQEALEAHKEAKREARRRREEAKKRKEENRRRSEVVQTISNPATLKKMLKSKKLRKQLRTADTGTKS